MWRRRRWLWGGGYSVGSSTSVVTPETYKNSGAISSSEARNLADLQNRNKRNSDNDNDVPTNVDVSAREGSQYGKLKDILDRSRTRQLISLDTRIPEPKLVSYDHPSIYKGRVSYTKFTDLSFHYTNVDPQNVTSERNAVRNNRTSYVLKYYKSYSSYAYNPADKGSRQAILSGRGTANQNANAFFNEATAQNMSRLLNEIIPSESEVSRHFNWSKTDLNRYYIVNTGLFPVFTGNGVVKSSFNNSQNLEVGYSPSQARSTNNGFYGSGVNVLVLDFNGHLNQDLLEKPSKPVNASAHTPYTSDNKGEMYHGARVSQVIAAPRLAKALFRYTYVGIAPQVNLSYFNIDRQSSAKEHREREKAIIEANPDIVNLSFGSGANQDSYFKYLFANYDDKYFFDQHYLKSGIAKSIRDPLYVFAAGNSLKGDYVNDPRNNFKAAIKRSLEVGDSYIKFTDPGAGIEIDQFSDLYHNLVDNILADNTIIAVGVQDSREEKENPGLFGFLNSTNKRNTLKTIREEVVKELSRKYPANTNYYREQLRIANENIDYFTHEAFFDESLKEKRAGIANVFADPGSFRCGVALYSCLAAPFTYSVQNSDTFRSKEKINGTSFSSPYISGIAALVKEQFPWMTAKQLKETLLSTATDLGKKGVDPVYGWGLVNAAGAMNGPRMFLYGNFVADMTRGVRSNGSYYFNNNIFGSAGLEVRGRSGDKLFLTGNSGYLGDTVVNSGNLYLVAGKKLGIPYSNDLASITSTVTTGKSGRFYAYDAALYGLNNFGYAELTNTKIKNDLVTYSGSTLTLTAGAPVGVAGKATINEGSKLVVLATNSVASSGYNYQQLLAANGGVNGQFSTVDLSRVRRNALSSYGVAYTQRGVFLANRSYNIQTAGVTLASYTGTDISAILAGANNLNILYETLGFDENAVTVHNGVDFTAAGVTSTSEDELVSTSQAEAGESVAKANELVNLEVKVTDTVTVPELKLAEAVSLAATEATVTEDTDNSNSGNINTSNSNTNTSNSNTNTATTATEATGTTSINPVLAKLVAGLQNATNNQLSAVFYSASLPAYSELTLLQSVQTTSRVQGFSNRILGDTATTKFNLYLDFEPQYRNISHSSTKARGKYTGNSGVIGVYGKYEDYLLGAAYFHGKSNYEQSYLGFATATGSVAGNGLSINLGKQLTAEQYLTANLYFSHDNYKLNRLIGYSTATNTITTTNSTAANSTTTPVFSYAKYSTNQYGIDLAWKGRLWQQANQSLSLTTRVNLNQLTQQAFREQVTEGLESLAYNLTKQKHTKLLAQVAVNYTDSFTLAEHKLQLNLGASLTYDSRYSSVTAYKVVGTNQATNKELSTAKQNQALAPFLVQTQAELGYELSEKVKLGVGSKFSFAKNYRDWNANANLTVGF